MSAPASNPKLAEAVTRHRHAERERRRREAKARDETARRGRRHPERRVAQPGPHYKPEDARRAVWAAVEEARRRVPPWSDPRWERSHAEAMAELRAAKRRAA